MKLLLLGALDDYTLAKVVHRAHWRMAMISVALAGVLLLLVSGWALRGYLEGNLHLLARSLAYNVEAALVFDDPEDAAITLKTMGQTESVCHMVVYRADGSRFAQWSQPERGWNGRVGEILMKLMRLKPASVDVKTNDGVVGRVVLTSDGQGFVMFGATGLASLLVCLAISAVVATRLSRGTLNDLIDPVEALAKVARAGRYERQLGMRAAPVRIAELRALGDDFNALLDELEGREAKLLQQNSVLEYLSQHDVLTGLPNRGFFEKSLESAIAAVRGSGNHLAVLFLDNDHFKAINDTYGHATGDRLLHEVAQRVRQQLRESDVVARLGGDEFAVLLSPLRDASDARHIADKILAALHQPWHDSAGTIAISMSVGIAVYPHSGATAAEMLSAADAAMYVAKKKRRGSCELA